MDKSLKIDSIIDRRIEKDEVEYYIRRREKTRQSTTVNIENDCHWVRENTIPAQLISQYNAKLIKGRDVELIIGATPTRAGNWFYVKWKSQISGCWLPSDVMKKHYPQALIQFYEKNLFF